MQFQPGFEALFVNAMHIQCDQMADAAKEYCGLIDHFNTSGQDQYWLHRMEKVLPRVHAAVVSLNVPDTDRISYRLPNDDMRCELFMNLNQVLLCNDSLWSGFDKPAIKQDMCERLADDFTDMYFDLKYGLQLLDKHPGQPGFAACNWHHSFYLHWGEHLVDAEGCLHAVEVRHFDVLSGALEPGKLKSDKKAQHH